MCIRDSNGTFTYGITTASKWGINTTVGYNSTSTFGIELDRILFGLGIKKTFWEDKLSFNTQANYFTVDLVQGNSQTQNDALNVLAQLDFKASKSHSFFSRFNLIKKGSRLAEVPDDLTESIINIGYRLNFSFQKTKKKKDEETEK